MMFKNSFKVDMIYMEIMMRKQKNRGLSYILSVVMMTLVISSLASVVLIWGIGQVNESQSSYSLAIDARKYKAQERLVIENVNFTTINVDGKFNVTVRNVGKVQIVIDKVYANHTSLSTDPPKIVLGVQEIGSIVAHVSDSPPPNGVYYVIVATSRGTTYGDYYAYSP